MIETNTFAVGSLQNLECLLSTYSTFAEEWASRCGRTLFFLEQIRENPPRKLTICDVTTQVEQNIIKYKSSTIPTLKELCYFVLKQNDCPTHFLDSKQLKLPDYLQQTT
jgi:hypothetical protein